MWKIPTEPFVYIDNNRLDFTNVSRHGPTLNPTPQDYTIIQPNSFITPTKFLLLMMQLIQSRSPI
eukprot:Pgem_evm1s3210